MKNDPRQNLGKGHLKYKDPYHVGKGLANNLSLPAKPEAGPRNDDFTVQLLPFKERYSFECIIKRKQAGCQRQI
jgi:hypothetical protein